MALTIEAKKSGKDNKVILRYSYSHKSHKYFSTGVVIPKSDFKKNVLENPVRSSNPNSAHLNRQVQSVYDKIQRIITDLKKEDKDPEASLVYHFYHKKAKSEEIKVQNSLLSVAFERFLKYENYDLATEKLYRTLYKHLLAFYGDIKMDGFNIDQWHAFKDYLQFDRKLKTNSICIRLSKFKHFLKRLISEGIEINMAKFPIPKEVIKKVMLDKQALQKIREYVPESDNLAYIKDLCLFQCFTGLRISDLKRLDRNHFVTNEGMFQISMTAYKTNKQQFIPLSDEAHRILVKYNFKFPEISESYYNRQLKRLAKGAELSLEIEWQDFDSKGKKIYVRYNIQKLISSHACCRTAMTYLQWQGYSIPDIAKILGKSMQTLMDYYVGSTTESNIIEHQRKVSGNQNQFLKAA